MKSYVNVNPKSLNLDFETLLSNKVCENAQWIVFVPSGKTDSLNSQTKDQELFDSIEERSHDKVCVRIAMPPKQHSRLASEDDVIARAQRLAIVIDKIQEFCPKGVSLVGISLGALAILKVFIQDWSVNYDFYKCYLIGCVLEYPANIYPKIDELIMVYGGRDYIGYVKEGKNQTNLLAPEAYSESTSKLMNTRPLTKKSVTVLENCDHYLWHQQNGFDEFTKRFFI